MRVPQSYVQKCKTAAHVFQGLFIFIAGCLTLAVLTKDGEIGGATRWYFALCFLSIPALIYLTMVPMWSRAVRFANAYAFIAVDALYTIFWFSAFIAIALWNSEGIKQGAKDKKLDEHDGNCTTFKYGPETKCKLSRATFGFGVVIWIFFALTTAISSYYLYKFRQTGHMPYESKTPDPYLVSGDPSYSATTKQNNPDDPWSAELGHGHHSDDESDDVHDNRTERGGNQEEDEYALLHSTETDEGRHPGRPLSWGSGERPVPPYAAYDEHVTALSPGGYEEYRSQTTPAPGGYSAGYGDGVMRETSGRYSFSRSDR
ncbi:hypothetical protein GQ43DRAFT_433537 [Delitschia confertaspora ATCC 74209]|uniref:MARVEL domain-containing protein n=1 Tax=Delitschia confertaspora ATCC 74209 TaxID=1513339 RepID=A0A9P4JHG5_9PLEO|nr:hypothetical protein GQ43DRAFT_433537 [Delitschia confertaspora ATCC 74209]